MGMVLELTPFLFRAMPGGWFFPESLTSLPQPESAILPSLLSGPHAEQPMCTTANNTR